MENINKRVDDEEHHQKYIKSDHYKSKMFESKVYDNFLSDKELSVDDINDS